MILVAPDGFIPVQEGQKRFFTLLFVIETLLDVIHALYRNLVPSMNRSYRADGLPIKQDPEASSASNLPAFVDPPAGAPPYHGFSIWEDVQVEGFTFGVITDFEETKTDWGDAFVVAPHNSRAGLVWSISNTPSFDQILPPDGRRWGVWGVSFDAPIKTKKDARRNLARIVPQLHVRWTQWRLLQRR